MVAKLKELRVKRGISQQALADAIGVSQQSINKYENHNVEPDLCTLMALADFFSTSVDYLIGYTQIDHVIEPVQSFELNEMEAKLIHQWRSLNKSQKESIFYVIRNYTNL
ncbi:MAG: helix-turn-helix transcriptional regulator [Ruminococcaceae bacterium]|nr:helix-turn-helix transcriptional regulator [Oscillospiraceae bacterium]